MQTLLHRNFRDDKFWQWVPSWQSVSASEFADYRWQFKHTVTKISELGQLLADKVAPEVMDNIQEGLRIAPMNIRLSPYILSLINWQAPLSDPIAKQFLPFASHMLTDHPLTRDDSLSEVNSTKAPYIVHRYPDKVLFLPLTAARNLLNEAEIEARASFASGELAHLMISWHECSSVSTTSVLRRYEMKNENTGFVVQKTFNLDRLEQVLTALGPNVNLLRAGIAEEMAEIMRLGVFGTPISQATPWQAAMLEAEMTTGPAPAA